MRAVAGAGRHFGLFGQGQLLGAGHRSAQTLLRHRARRRSAAPRREGAGQGPAAGRSAAVGPAGDTRPARPAGRGCRLAGARSAAATTAHPGRPEGAARARKPAAAACPGVRGSALDRRRDPGAAREPGRKHARPVACCCWSTTVPTIGTAGRAGPTTRSCASIRSRRQGADELLSGLLGDAPDLVGAEGSAARGERGQSAVPGRERTHSGGHGRAVRRTRRLPHDPAAGRDRDPRKRRRDHRRAHRPSRRGREERRFSSRR